MRERLLSTLCVLFAACSVAMADVFHVNDVKIRKGRLGELAIQLTLPTDARYRGFQFDLSLPQGFSVKADNNQEPGFTLGDGFGDIIGSSNYTESDNHGVARYLFYYMSVSEESGFLPDGSVLTLPLQVDASVEEGQYQATLHDIAFSQPVAGSSEVKSVSADDITFNLEVVSDTLMLSEDDVMPPAATNEKENIIVKRTVKAGEWSTLCLPFDMTGEQLADAFGSDAMLAYFRSYSMDENTSTINVNFETVDLSDGLVANYPYIVKTSADVSEFSLIAVYEPDESNAVAIYETGSGPKKTLMGSFFGTLRAGTMVPEGALFISDNLFWYSVGKTSIKAFRAYLDLTDKLDLTDDSAASNVKLVVDGDVTTGIGSAAVGQRAAGHSMGVFDLQGRRVDVVSQKGIYVKDGKKVIVK